MTKGKFTNNEVLEMMIGCIIDGGVEKDLDKRQALRDKMVKEYNLILRKKSKLSASQREIIVDAFMSRSKKELMKYGVKYTEEEGSKGSDE